MPRPHILRNDTLHVAFDEDRCVRDLFWPQLGYPNHLNGRKMRWGIHSQHQMFWCDDPRWERETDGLTHIPNHHLSLYEHWQIDPQLSLVSAAFSVHTPGPFVFFVTHPLCINESNIGDTACYDPLIRGIRHYKNGTVFESSLHLQDGSGPTEWACGYKEFQDLEGTWRDAEDGQLSGKAIEQGSVDSTIGVHGDGHAVVTWQFGFRTENEDSFIREPRMYSVNWDGPAFPRPELSGVQWPNFSQYQRLNAEFAESNLAYIRGNICRNGAILAATDSDILDSNLATYCYCWPRDGALVAEVLTDCGDLETVDRFFDFCLDTFPSDPPVFLQKYSPDGSLGASWHPWIWDGQPITPFQQDETASIISAIVHRRRHDSDSFAAFPDLFDRLIRPACDFFLDYRGEDGLPLPSWDLWEERRGVHFYTTCTVVKALHDAASLPGGDERWLEAANQITASLSLFEEDGKYLRTRTDGTLDPTPDASVVAGMLAVPHLLKTDTGLKTLEWIRTTLDEKSPAGGCVRYTNDYYFRQVDDRPGNPWIICSMWLAQADLLNGNPNTAESALGWAHWVGHDIGISGALPEQIHPITGRHLSVSPLTWSHAEVLRTMLLGAAYNSKNPL